MVRVRCAVAPGATFDLDLELLVTFGRNEASEVTPIAVPTYSIHIEMAGQARVSEEGGIDADLMRAVLGSLLRCLKPRAWCELQSGSMSRALHGVWQRFRLKRGHLESWLPIRAKCTLELLVFSMTQGSAASS
jgi:hypothetical protein